MKKKYRNSLDADRGAGGRTWSGVSSIITDFRFCEVQNRRRKCSSLVLNMMWSPKKKKVFTEILTVFLVEFRWSPLPQKKAFGLHMLISQCHFNGPPHKPMSPLLGPLKPTAPWWAPLEPMGPLSPWAPKSLSFPDPPLSAALDAEHPMRLALSDVVSRF